MDVEAKIKELEAKVDAISKTSAQESPSQSKTGKINIADFLT